MVTERDIQGLADRIAAEFRPRRVVLFGSYAHGTPRTDSDVDLLVIVPVDGPRYKVAGAIRAKLTGEVPIDVVVRSPEEFAAPEGDPIILEALRSGRVLYAAA